MSKQPKVALYCRISKEPLENKAWIYTYASKQSQAYTNHLHIEELKEDATRQGFTIVGISCDLGVKDDPIKRQGIQTMLEAVRRGDVGIVMIIGVDHISQNPEKARPVLQQLYVHGMQLYNKDANFFDGFQTRNRRKGGQER